MAIPSENGIQTPLGAISCSGLNSRERTDMWGPGAWDELVPQEKAPEGAYKKQILYLSLFHVK